MRISSGSWISPAFQSSPNPKVGCHQTTTTRLNNSPRFQSSPNPKVGCHPVPCKLVDMPSQVSILTQPEGWVPYSSKITRRWQRGCFNPHPTRRLGAMCPQHPAMVVNHRFNPHPTRRLGAIIHEPLEIRSTDVSILTQPEGWVP